MIHSCNPAVDPLRRLDQPPHHDTLVSCRIHPFPPRHDLRQKSSSTKRETRSQTNSSNQVNFIWRAKVVIATDDAHQDADHDRVGWIFFLSNSLAAHRKRSGSMNPGWMDDMDTPWWTFEISLCLIKVISFQVFQSGNPQTDDEPMNRAKTICLRRIWRSMCVFLPSHGYHPLSISLNFSSWMMLDEMMFLKKNSCADRLTPLDPLLPLRSFSSINIQLLPQTFILCFRRESGIQIASTARVYMSRRLEWQNVYPLVFLHPIN